MKPQIKFQHIRRLGVLLTIAAIACLVLLVTWLIYKIFDYQVDDSMIAITIAALSLIYEINKSKKLNEAEFLIHLNSLFITNDNYKVVYNLLSNYDFENEPDYHKEISNCDISNYLTLFETFYILLMRKVIDISLLDDLFAYRFFLAAHNPYIQRKKLAVSPKNFKNIFRLERLWLSYRKETNLKDNYFTESYHLIYRSSFEKYLAVFSPRQQATIIKEMTVPQLDAALGYDFKVISGNEYADQINQIQKETVIQSDKIHKGMLRANTEEMISSCLNPPHDTVGVFHNNELVGFGILYDPNVDLNESIKKELDLTIEKAIADIDDQDIMHIKLVIIKDEHRGHHLQYHVNKELERLAREKGKKLLLTTVSPYNVPSVKNTFKSGFTYKKTVKKYDGAIRLIYAKFI